MIFDIFYGKHGVMQPVASFEAIHLNGTKSQAALHGAVTETMIGSNAPTRIKISRQVDYTTGAASQRSTLNSGGMGGHL
jgi:hypothetical protein